MKTFFLLTAVVFLTIQVQAQFNKEEMLTQEEAMTENQFPELPSMEAENSDTMASDPQQRKVVTCYCKSRCGLFQRLSGSCRINGITYRLCCR
ncbi:defensin-A2-like [Dromiciops gliroides]|uniref:defensin-A2-like n=1 Tax=Dromiciops gliroides TaxID=33562 RepID=UPI001CC5B2B8|nr:defensin-A2-like [Dromiciops gliroides]